MVRQTLPKTTTAAGPAATKSEPPSWIYPNILEPLNNDHNNKSESITTPLASFELKHILRAHSQSTHDGQDDVENDTWACAFMPSLPQHRPLADQHYHYPVTLAVKDRSTDMEVDEQDLSSNNNNDSIGRNSIVATCGGNSVCLIDCQLGRIISKFSHLDEEEFLTLAWTTLEHYRPPVVKKEDEEDEEDTNMTDVDAVLDDNKPQVNILAVGGKLGSIKLLDAKQNICYRYLTGHTGSVVQLRFSLICPRLLFSASSDQTVRLWDIGPGSGANPKESECLAKFVGLDKPVTAIGVSYESLIVGTESGMMAKYSIGELQRQFMFKISDNQDQQQEAAAYFANKRHNLNIKPDTVFPASGEWHESSVDDIVFISKFSKDSLPGLRIKDGKSGRNGRKKYGVQSTRGKSTGNGRGKGNTRAASSSRTRESSHDVKRGRGRPKKKDQESGEEDEEEESDTLPPVKKGRGRPKKKQESEEEGDEEESAAPPPTKKGRGRPKKIQAVVQDEHGDDGEDEEEDEDDEEQEEVGEADDGLPREEIFASRESCQGEILIWDATKSTPSDAKIKTILDWPIADSQTRMILVENFEVTHGESGTNHENTNGKGKSKSKSLSKGAATTESSTNTTITKVQNVLLSGETEGKILMFDVNVVPKRRNDKNSNIIAEQPSMVVEHEQCDELLRSVAVNEDQTLLVSGDWDNRVFIWTRV